VGQALNFCVKFACQRINLCQAATVCGLESPGIESRDRGDVFRRCPQLSWEPTSLLYNGHQLSLQGVKRSGRGADHPLPSSDAFTNGLEPYLLHPSVPE